MLTYQNDASIKSMFEARFAAHRAADEVIQGTGFDNGRGCFIGCTMNKYDHESFANQIGPKWLAHLADTIFEGLPKEEAPQFGTDLLAAIPVGADIENVRFTIAIARHKRQLARLESKTEPYAEKCRDAIKGVIDYCEAELAGVGRQEMRVAAESAAWSAALSAGSAESAARSAAWSAWSARAAAAWSAARSAESAARSATWSAESAWSAAESAARSATWSAESAWSAARSATWSAESAWSAWSAESAESAQTEYQHERDALLAALREFS